MLVLCFFCWWFQWIPELHHYAPGVPVVLVGTKLGMWNTRISFRFSYQLTALKLLFPSAECQGSFRCCHQSSYSASHKKKRQEEEKVTTWVFNIVSKSPLNHVGLVMYSFVTLNVVADMVARFYKNFLRGRKLK
ncbi:hypothetical protein B296_00054274 [Ensete ventricosum]|uniref:Uncharacterized protein n=1 Tax=Ensete ventricosum TaxID=4639 RepID=A0A426XD70_ENSVE|nr:hypothetical protein B296_00054274 [Ensete ventricosum]